MPSFSVASSINDVSILNNVGGGSWNSCITASTGTAIDSGSLASLSCQVGSITSGGNLSKRVFLYFNTGAYIPAGASVKAATLDLHGLGASSNADLSPLHFVLGTFPVGVLSTANFGDLNKSLEFANTTAFGGLSRSIPITNLSLISTTSYTKMVVIGQKDYSGALPTTATVTNQDFDSANGSSSAYWPTLTVTYELANNTIVNFI